MLERRPTRPGQIALVAIVILYIGILLGAPLAAVGQRAFASGIDAVIKALTDKDVLAAFRLTGLLVLAATVINTLAGIALAWVLVRQRFPGRDLINGLVDLPFVVSPVIIGYVIIIVFGRQGWFPDLPIQIAFSWPGMLLVTVFVSLPFVTREVMPVLAALTREQEEAAQTLGASPLLTFRRVVLPAIWPGVLYGIVLTLARALGEFGAVAVAGGGIQGVTETATIYIFRALHDRNAIGAYSLAIVLGLASIIILLLMNLLRVTPDRKSQ